MVDEDIGAVMAEGGQGVLGRFTGERGKDGAWGGAERTRKKAPKRVQYQNISVKDRALGSRRFPSALSLTDRF